MNEPVLTRRDELLADTALGWLDGADDAALHVVLREPEWRGELDALERTAALTARALAEPADGIDAQRQLVGLTARLHADALAFCATRARAASRAELGSASGAGAARARMLPWLLAAAAAIALALWPERSSGELPAPLAREALLRAEHGVLTCAWQRGPSPAPAEVHGDVVWDTRRQEGYLRLQGLPALDPEHRYQLWIVDAAREGPPVDGGLLPPLAADGEAVVRIDARLPVQRAAAFVLTRERAQGAVVSTQEHVVAIAKP